MMPHPLRGHPDGSSVQIGPISGHSVEIAVGGASARRLRLARQAGAAEPDDYAGSFLKVATNGLSVLETLGLRDQLVADAFHCPYMVMWSGRGKRLGPRVEEVVGYAQQITKH